MKKEVNVREFCTNVETILEAIFNKNYLKTDKVIVVPYEKWDDSFEITNFYYPILCRRDVEEMLKRVSSFLTCSNQALSTESLIEAVNYTNAEHELDDYDAVMKFEANLYINIGKFIEREKHSGK